MHIIGVCGRKGSGKDTVGDVLTQQCGFQRVALADPIKQLVHQVFNLNEETLFGPSAARERLIPEASDPAWWNHAWAMIETDAVQARIERLFREPAEAVERLRTLMKHTLEPYGSRITARVLLQQLGTEWGRAIDENVWVRQVFFTADALMDGFEYHPMLGRTPPPNKPNRSLLAGVVVTDVRFYSEVRNIQRYTNFMRSARGHVWTVNAQQRLPPQDLNEHASEPAYEDTALWADTIIDNNGAKDDLPPIVIREALALQLK